MLLSSCAESFGEIQSNNVFSKRGVRTLFRIECDTGKDISAHSYHHNIEEILLLPGVQLRVIDRIHFNNDLWIIHLKETKSPSSYLQPTLITSANSHISPKRNENKSYSAPLSSLKYCATNSLHSQRNNSISLPVVEVETELTKKNITRKPYVNKILQELIKTERTKESVRFSKQMLNYDDMKIISNELISNKYWTILYLWESYMNEKHIMILSHGLKLNSTLICLNLDCNLLGDEGTSILASVLKVNTSLRTVCLNKNEIKRYGR